MAGWARPQPILRRELSPAAVRTPYGKQVRSSSPGPGLLASPQLASFSDMSSVRQPGSAERSLPTHVSSLTGTPQDFNRIFPNTVALSPSVSHSRYIRELPALLPIHHQLMAESPPSQIRTHVQVHSHAEQRVRNEFGLLLNTAGRHFHGPPPFRPPPDPTQPSYRTLPYTISYPTRSSTMGTMGMSQWPLATSSPPRSRHASKGSQDPLRRRPSPLTIAVLSPASRSSSAHRMTERCRSEIVEYSPQSQSSSSGFDSKNTSQQNQSSQSGSGQLHHFSADASPLVPWTSGGRSMESHYVNWPVKSTYPVPPVLSLLDASVDNHYEFDTTHSPNETAHEPSLTFIPSPATATATATAAATATATATVVADSSGPGPGRHRKVAGGAARSENIEARVQAMKQEFQEYRKRRARGLLESAC